MIHAKRLSETTFFDVHGAPGEGVAEALKAVSRSRDSLSEVQVKEEEDDGQAASTPTTLQDTNLANHPPDYLLAPTNKDSAAAFGYVAQHLYNETIPEILDRKTLKIVLMAYQYARQYNCYSLQNILVDRFRRHYLSCHVKIDELQWLINKFGDDVNATPLTRYILEQVAHDIAVRGFIEFSEDNKYLEYFLKESDRNIRHAMFAVLARHATCAVEPRSDIKDPAENSKDWKVDEKGNWTPRVLCSK